MHSLQQKGGQQGWFIRNLSEDYLSLLLKTNSFNIKCSLWVSNCYLSTKGTVLAPEFTVQKPAHLHTHTHTHKHTHTLSTHWILLIMGLKFITELKSFNVIFYRVSSHHTHENDMLFFLLTYTLTNCQYRDSYFRIETLINWPHLENHRSHCQHTFIRTESLEIPKKLLLIESERREGNFKM